MRIAIGPVVIPIIRLFCVLSCLFAAMPVTHRIFAAERVLVFAAASTIDAMEALASKYGQETGLTVTISAAGSGTLARQIEAGAPADIFLSANPEWMDYLERKGLIVPESRYDLIGNTLVVVGPAGEAESGDVAQLLGSGRFAMGDPGHVPAGLYARQALETLGLWPTLSDHAVLTENVRVALALASRGEIAHAIVYGSDATVEPDITVVYRFPAETHEPIAYPAALTSNAGVQAKAFLDYVAAAAESGFFTKYGFVSGMKSG